MGFFHRCKGHKINLIFLFLLTLCSCRSSEAWSNQTELS